MIVQTGPKWFTPTASRTALFVGDTSWAPLDLWSAGSIPAIVATFTLLRNFLQHYSLPRPGGMNMAGSLRARLVVQGLALSDRMR